jgi:hypothetical protein
MAKLNPARKQRSNWINERTKRPYSGPVHYHNGRAMVGARHTSQPHDYLSAAPGTGGHSLYSYQDCITCGQSAGDALNGGGQLNMGACSKCRDYIATL